MSGSPPPVTGPTTWCSRPIEALLAARYALAVSAGSGVGPLVLFSGPARPSGGGRSAAAPGEPSGIISDPQLIALAREAHHEAFNVLYIAYKARIYSFLLRFLADAEAADDVTQETFTKAYPVLPSLAADHRLLPWLYRIASNAAVDHLRRRRRFSWLRLAKVSDTAEEPSELGDADTLGERDHVRAVLRRLPPENAIALLLHAVEGYSYKEIADIQGASMTAVRSRIARARQAFRRAYEPGDRATN